MLSLRAHGAIDYGVSALLGLAATASDLPLSVRRLLGAAALYHTSYAMLTDYPGGLRPRLSMTRHLALDAVGAGLLGAAGLVWRGLPAPSRALLLGIGIAEFAVIAASENPDAAPPTYEPLDTPKQIAPDVFVVDSALPGAAGRLVPVRMTVLRLPDGDLILHAPTRFSPRLKRELERRGSIRHLVAPSAGHWMFLAAWQRHCPEAQSWATPGLPDRRPVRRAGLRFDHVLPGDHQAAWSDTVRAIVVPGALGFSETVLFHTPTRTLVVTDLVANLRPRKIPLLLRPAARLLGLSSPGGTTARYLRPLLLARRGEARRAVSELLALAPERMIVAHGDIYASEGTQALRRALAWLHAS